jgi:hypothetical protein
MTLIDLLIAMFWTLCCSLLDLPIRHYLGLPVPHESQSPGFIAGVVIGILLPLYLDAKHVRKRPFAVLMSIPLCVALLSICFLRACIVTFHIIEFALGFYVPILWWGTKILLWVVFNPFPTCKNGKCCGIHDFLRDVELPEGKQVEGTNQPIAYKCRCGDEYLRSGKQFMALDSERTPRPYKKLIGFHKWVDDLDQ